MELTFIDYLLVTASVIVGVLAALALLGRARNFITALHSEHWAEARGRIVRARMMKIARGFLYRPEVVYEYDVGGMSHTGTAISAAGELPIYPNAQERMQRYPSGTAVTVFYDPKHPDHAVLERSGALTINVYMIVLITILLASIHMIIRVVVY